MTAPTSDKLDKLQQLLARQPGDAFLLYGIAMEYRKLRDFERAVDFFNRTIEVDPAYCYAYFHRGQTHELAGDAAAARQSYRDGIAAAERAGDAHAKEELQAALEMLG